MERTRACFENLRKNFDQRNTLSSYLKKGSQANKSGLTTSYERAQIIAKTASGHTVAENVIGLFVLILMKTMLQQVSANVLKALPLSNDSIQRRIDKMSSDVESKLVEKSKTIKFSI